MRRSPNPNDSLLMYESHQNNLAQEKSIRMHETQIKMRQINLRILGNL